MKITIEGVVVENTLNVRTLVGSATALDKVYQTTVADGVLNIVMAKNGGKLDPMVAAILVRKLPPNRSHRDRVSTCVEATQSLRS